MNRQGANERVRGLCVCGDSLRELRIMRGLTQLELAKLAGYSERLVRKAEAGGALSLTSIEDLAEALSCKERRVVASDLCSFPEGIARKFVECYDEHERHMLDYCGHLLSADFVFHCAGEASSLVGGRMARGRRFSGLARQTVFNRPPPTAQMFEGHLHDRPGSCHRSLPRHVCSSR